MNSRKIVSMIKTPLLGALALLSVFALPSLVFGGEADLVIPSLDLPIAFGMTGTVLLMIGLVISAIGLAFGNAVRSK